MKIQPFVSPTRAQVEKSSREDFSTFDGIAHAGAGGKIPVEIRTIPSREISRTAGNLDIPYGYWQAIAPLDLDLQKH
jgi:hypothetical protein